MESSSNFGGWFGKLDAKLNAPLVREFSLQKFWKEISEVFLPLIVYSIDFLFVPVTVP